LTRFTPWEAVRIDRALRCQIVAALVQTSGLQDPRALAISDLCERQNDSDRSYFDMQIWGSVRWSLTQQIEWRVCSSRLYTVSTAINRWYNEHDRTLPESLDELVGTYLEKLPVHPFTNKGVEYHRNAPPPDKLSVPGFHWSYFGYDVSVRILGKSSEKERDWQAERNHTDAFLKSGGTYLRLGQCIVVLIEEESNQEEATEPQS